eukprot:TRINITY_DN7931_c0_g1_i1.p1 TRINITY_DN7931_c0_g1~~TRINITY_DN7931_c0_g1_i1.p1  ORF type:complete len:191 (-),score=31.90 TRINITY_DN7931_c0_g1_i1:81-653(-)
MIKSYILLLLGLSALSQAQFPSFRRIVQAPRQVTRYTHGCEHAQPNFLGADGKKYLLTFLNGCKSFTGEEADAYCVANGGHAISIDTTAKGNFVVELMAKYAQRYIWTSGRVDHANQLVRWASGASEGYQRGTRFWSHTGGSSKTQDIPQPDNRDGNEVCLGVLNNFYADGIKWHDVGCSHKKPTICEYL